MKQLFFTVFLLLFFTLTAQSQVTPPTVQACGTEQKFCLDDTMFELCVKITVTTGLPADIDHFEIDWGDNSAITTVPGGNNPANQFHTYEFFDFYLECEYEKKYFVVLETYLVNGDVLNSSFQVTFQNPPTAQFNISPSIICVGEQACFDDNSCPTENLSIVSWDYGDGSPIGLDECHIYNSVGTFNVTLIVENNCGTASVSHQITVIEPAESNISIASNNIDDTADPYIYCLGSGLVDFNGDSLSLNENSYAWNSLNSYPGASWVFPPNIPNDNTPNIYNPSILFTDTGIYQIILEVDNDCNQPNFDTIFIQVLSAQALSQPDEPDACIELIYTPENYNPNATYMINGAIENNFPITLTEGSYEVICSLTNECGPQSTVDNFEVFGQENVSISFPSSDTIVCLGSDSIMLLYEPLGGIWTGQNLTISGDTVIFYPDDIGSFTLTYSKGATGTACEDSKSITITVEDSGITVIDYVKCSSNPSFPMGGIPFGGTYSSIDCPSCIQNDTFIISEMVALGLTTIDIDYNVTNSSGCEGNNSFSVSIDDPLATFEIDSIVCLGDIVNVDISNTNGTLTWMIDGQISSPPPFTNLSSGNHTIKLTAETFGCEEESMRNIYVIAPPMDVSFTAIPIEGCADLEVILTNTTPDFDDEAFEWYVGDSLFSTATQPGSIILGSGLMDTTYTITLIAGNDCDGSLFEEIITVFPRPIPRFGPMQNTYCSGDTVTFANVSYGGPMLSWFWDYGNGFTSTDSVPLPMIYFTDSIPTIYTITLTATNDCGTEIFSYDLEVNPTNVVAFYNINPIEGCVGTEVCLTNLSTLGAHVLWDFGDGNTSTLFNVCHTYSSPGMYTITLKAFGCGFDSIQQTIIIHSQPDALFTNNTISCPVDSVSFSNLSVGANSYLWDFGDGNTSTLNNPTHMFTIPGIYQVSLISSSIEGCIDSTTSTITILSPPAANFNISTDSICIGEIVLFESASSPNPLTCLWDFGDGNFSTSCQPSHSYDTSGNYIITLIISDGNNCKDTTQQLIFVSSIPDADFTYTVNQTCSPVSVSFSNNINTGESYLWDFGDGNTSTLTSPTHTYEVGGTYTVQLTTISGVCSQTNSQEVVINQTPIFEIVTPSAQSGCANFLAPFSTSLSGNNFAYLWDFGDGITSFEESPIHPYTIPGDYEVSLIIQNLITQCADTASLIINVFEPITADATIINVPCFGEINGAIDIDVNSGTSPFQYEWSSSIVTQDLNDIGAGTYTITITDANNCSWEEMYEVTQPSPITTNIIDESIVTCFGGSDGGACIEVNGGVADYTINWEIGVEESCIENVIAGEYLVEVSDANGCVEEFLIPIQENPEIQIIDNVENISCFGANDGSIHLDSILGGVSSFYNTTLTGSVNYDGGNSFPDLLPGEYQLIVQDLEGCILESTYVIGEPDSLWVVIPQDTFYLGLGDSVWLEASHNADEPFFEWTPASGLSCEDCEDPIALPYETITYGIEVVDINGCLAQDSVTLVVDPNRKFYIPNTFTPNGDGRNDYFRIRSRLPSIKQVNVFRIFSRWGDMLFEAENFRPQDEELVHAWDGRFRNKLLSPDQFVYYVEIEYLDGEKEVVNGTVFLVR